MAWGVLVGWGWPCSQEGQRYIDDAEDWNGKFHGDIVAERYSQSPNCRIGLEYTFGSGWRWIRTSIGCLSGKGELLYSTSLLHFSGWRLRRTWKAFLAGAVCMESPADYGGLGGKEMEGNVWSKFFPEKQPDQSWLFCGGRIYVSVSNLAKSVNSHYSQDFLYIPFLNSQVFFFYLFHLTFFPHSYAL